jgi:triacylglycerol lipase
MPMETTTPQERKRVAELAANLTWKSKLDGPIRELPLLRRSLLLAELSAIAYLNPPESELSAARLGFDEAIFFNRDGSQAYLFENETDAVIACRGTEPNEWNDIRADANAVTAVAETFGRVHRGFKREVDDLWPQLEEALANSRRPLWFTGHSLGGAMATICAGRCKLSQISSGLEELHTFGSPRVGDKRYVNYCQLAHYRWVNNNDIVTRVPPGWFGYRHSGQEIYLNANGKIRRMSPWQRTKDRWRGFWRGLRAGRIDHFSDHSLVGYIQHVEAAVEMAETGDVPRFLKGK